MVEWPKFNKVGVKVNCTNLQEITIFFESHRLGKKSSKHQKHGLFDSWKYKSFIWGIHTEGNGHIICYSAIRQGI